MLGYISSVLLLGSGLAAMLIPGQVAPVQELQLSPGRATAEYRIANAALVGLGVWALIDGSSAAFGAIAAAWLAAAAVRVLALAVDRPATNATYWAILAFEAAAGALGLVGAARAG